MDMDCGRRYPAERRRFTARGFRDLHCRHAPLVELARRGKRDVAIPPDIPPVKVPPTPEWAERLKVRLDRLEDAIRPFFEN